MCIRDRGASLRRFLGFDLLEDLEVTARLKEAREHIAAGGIPPEKLQDALVSGIVLRAEEACMGAVFFESAGYNARDRKLDRWLTSKRTRSV